LYSGLEKVSNLCLWREKPMQNLRTKFSIILSSNLYRPLYTFWWVASWRTLLDRTGTSVTGSLISDAVWIQVELLKSFWWVEGTIRAGKSCEVIVKNIRTTAFLEKLVKVTWVIINWLLFCYKYFMMAIFRLHGILIKQFRRLDHLNVNWWHWLLHILK
jgi:hypothetical protein